MKHVTPVIDDSLYAELPAYLQAANEFAGDWLFKPPSVWTILEQVRSFKKNSNAPVGLDFLQFWNNHAARGLDNWSQLVQFS